jgi:predicted nucleic acid-binding protein
VVSLLHQSSKNLVQLDIVGFGCSTAGSYKIWWLLDQLGGIHLERLGELPQRGHARLDLVALDPGYRRRGDAGALGKLCLDQGEFELVVSTHLLYELQAVLSREAFRRYLTFPQLHRYVMWIADRARVGPDSTDVPRYTGDPDDYLVALALDTEAEVIITSDSHLHDYTDTIPVAVAEPRAFLDVLHGY